MLDESRWCDDIGMAAIDRPIPSTCVHRTEFCNATCYNNKLYKVYPKMHDKDVRNEAFWEQLTGAQLQGIINSNAKIQKMKHLRFRLMTRGEAFTDFRDVARVKDLAVNNENVVFWIPTRAWREPILRATIMGTLFPLGNVRVLASTDPTTSAPEWEQLKLDGWSTMFYGDNEMTVTPNGDRVFLCPKTHKSMKGHCNICKAGCFKPMTKGRVDVHLKQH